LAQVIEVSDDGQVTVYEKQGDQMPVGPKAQSGASELGDADAFALAARRHGLDAKLLRAVAWTESRGRNSAVSPKGALGIMQLMPATAASLGVDPRDPIANIEGGAAYLAKQLSAFGSVPLALAAYNAGPGAVIRYRGIPPFAETRAYVDGIMRRLNGATSDLPLQSSPGLAASSAIAPPTKKELPVLLIEVPST
jgi:soluble lytic murein transglycosylase-like protein